MLNKIVCIVGGILLPLVSICQENAVIEARFQKEVKKLVRNKKVIQAMTIIDESDARTISDLIELTEIPAPPFGEQLRGVRFSELLLEAGAKKVWTDSIGNVLALRPGTERTKTVVLDAHLDTVFPIDTDVKVKVSGDTLRAPGIGDDTRGLSMVLAILRAMNAADIQTKSDLLFVATVGEEGLGDLRGVKYLFRKDANVKIDSWISIDGGSMGRVNNGALGSIRYRAIFEAPGGHSWGAFGLANPHHAMAKAIDYFVTSAAEYTASGQKTSFNIGTIGGGTSVNSIPFESWFEVDMRSLSADRLLVMDSLFKASIESAVFDYNQTGVNDEVTLRFEKIGHRPSGELPSNTPIIQRTLAVTEEFGVPPRLTTGSTNSNIPISLGIPAVTLGRGGRGGNAHALDEWWANIAGARAIKLALLVTIMEVGLD